MSYWFLFFALVGLFVVGACLVFLHHAIITLDYYPKGTLCLMTAESSFSPTAGIRKSSLRCVLNSKNTGDEIYRYFTAQLEKTHPDGDYVVTSFTIIKPGSM